MKTTHKILLGLGITGLIVFLVKKSKTAPTSSTTTSNPTKANPNLSALQKASWTANGDPVKLYKPISMNSDGSVNIGDNYRGYFTDSTTVETNERNGKANKKIIWKATFNGVSGADFLS